jgi:2-succinyl-5-enolpyruvyl-6-hydroxy-3-cyclohexene-1-carboxylate synthase
VDAAALRDALGSGRGVIVAGARTAASERDRRAVLGLARALGWPVLADALSGVRVPHPNVVSTFDPVLRACAADTGLRPDVVLRIGGLLASRVTNEWLSASGATHVGIDRHGRCPDPDRTLSACFRVDVGAACEALAGTAVDATGGEWLARWRAVDDLAREAIDAELADLPDSEPAVAAAALAEVPDGGDLVVSSSMPVRDLEWFAPPRPGVRVLANRGANGIDGVVSTAVGVALAGRPTTVLLGDLALLHDTNGLAGLARRDVALRIVVVDNDGGGIFSFLPQATALPPERFEQLFGTPHGADLSGLVAAHGVTHLVELHRSDRAANRAVHARLFDAVAARLRA